METPPLIKFILATIKELSNHKDAIDNFVGDNNIIIDLIEILKEQKDS